MTTETCPLCGGKLEDFGGLDFMTCENCSYVKVFGTSSGMETETQILYRLAEILAFLEERVKNINTDEELEEMEEEIAEAREFIKNFLGRLQEKKMEEIEDPIYPSPHKPRNPQPWQPWQPGTIWMGTDTNPWDENTTSTLLDNIKGLMKGNDES